MPEIPQRFGMLSGFCRLLPVNIVYESDVHILKQSNKNSLNASVKFVRFRIELD